MGLYSRCILGLSILLCIASFSFSQSNDTPIVMSTSCAIFYKSTGDTLRISATVKSLYEISKVTAVVNGNETELHIVGSTFLSYIDISKLSKGDYQAKVKALDVKGDSVEAAFNFGVRRPAKLVVTDPLPGTVIRSTLKIKAQAISDFGIGTNTRITVDYNGNFFLRVNSDRIDTVVNGLSEFKGMNDSGYIKIEAYDSIGRMTSAWLYRISIDSSARLKNEIQYQGAILDLDSENVLTGQILSDGYKNLQIVSRNNVQDTISMINFGLSVPWSGAGLSAHGAFFPDRANPGLYEYRNGAITKLTSDIDNFKMNKYYECWKGSNYNNLLLRDVVAQTTDSIVGSQYVDYPGKYDVSLEGIVAFEGTSNSFRCNSCKYFWKYLTVSGYC